MSSASNEMAAAASASTTQFAAAGQDNAGVPTTPIIGLDVVGRGIYLRPNAPYKLTRLLFPHGAPRPYHSRETRETYAVPGGYEINDSPPMPANQALNQVVIEESFDRFSQQLRLDAGMATGSKMFSVDATAAQTSQLRTAEEAYYALRTSFVPLWAVYLPDPTAVAPDTFDLSAVPSRFEHAYRESFEAFFARYGTHFVSSAWVGGKGSLAFSVLKSTQMSKSDIQAGLKASFGLTGTVQHNTDLQLIKERLQSSARCTVWGKGGDELKLASLSTFDAENYNAWLVSIARNPQVIELQVSGIWNIVPDKEKARALHEAYTAETTFIPISAIFHIGEKFYFIRGRRYFVYNLGKGESTKPRRVSEDFSALAQAGFDRIDAAFSAGNFSNPSGVPLNSKIYVFRKDKYVRFDFETNLVDAGYPKPITTGFPGIEFESIDAILSTGNKHVYFFRGKHFIRFDLTNWRADEGYPELTSRRWVGLTFDRIDAAVYLGNGKAYFFKGDQHIRYDMSLYEADPGYPKSIVGSYVEDWKFFD